MQTRHFASPQYLVLAVIQSSGINSIIRDFLFMKICSLSMILIPQTIRRVDGETDN